MTRYFVSYHVSADKRDGRFGMSEVNVGGRIATFADILALAEKLKDSPDETVVIINWKEIKP